MIMPVILSSVVAFLVAKLSVMHCFDVVDAYARETMEQILDVVSETLKGR